MVEGLLSIFHLLPNNKNKITILEDVSGVLKPCRMTLLLDLTLKGTIGEFVRCNADHYSLGRNDTVNYAFDVSRTSMVFEDRGSSLDGYGSYFCFKSPRPDPPLPGAAYRAIVDYRLLCIVLQHSISVQNVRSGYDLDLLYSPDLPFELRAEMALLVEGLAVGGDTSIEEYIICPANDLTEYQDSEAEKEQIKLYGPKAGLSWVAKPVRGQSTIGLVSRHGSLVNQGMPLVDPIVTLFGSV
ncbi:hypothetical protein POM88_046986 [Heracleum sosnowskyi]|uniref:Uncharacterized protein n=1 Tax=Heracleum sosnowskyi TaxID=360622 RepID=A0AAD8H786_9APIA|nr:hypothetical protein POM88_046986 [Heracleum sosnowskyi]